MQDLKRGHGCCLIDPHGDLAERVLDHVPRHRIDDVVYLNPADLEFPMPLNILEAVHPDQHHLVTSGLVSTFARFWSEFWGPRTEYIIRNCVAALLEAPHASLLDLSHLLVDENFRREILGHVRNPATLQFWHHEFAAWPDRYRQEAIAPIQNKVGEFLLTPLIRNIVGQHRNLWQLRSIMDRGGILIVNLAKGRIGEDTANLLGSLLLTRLLLAALARADVPETERRPFFVYVDEFHSFATPKTYITLLSEARKFALSVTLAQQFLSQNEDPRLTSSIFGNVGTLISFRTSAEDAPYLAREFGNVVTPEDITGLDQHNIYLRMTVNSRTSAPFGGQTLAPPPPEKSYREEIVRRSRERYARRREVVERGTERRFMGASDVAMVGRGKADGCSRPEPRPRRRSPATYPS